MSAALVAAALLASGAVSLLGGRAPDGTARERTAAADGCDGAPESQEACLRRRLVDLTRQRGAAAALGELASAAVRSDAVRASCHGLAHQIGRVAGGRGGDVASAFAAGSQACSAGYYHGVMESAVAGVGGDRPSARISALCAGVRGGAARRSRAHYDCAHGLGHGIMRARRTLPRSLAACDRLADPWERERCSGGAFMQMTMAEPAPRSAALDRALSTCARVPSRHAGRCYLYEAQRAVAASGGDVPRVFALCRAVDGPARSGCDRGVGAAAAGQAFRQSITDRGRAAAASLACEFGRDAEARAECAAGAVAALSLARGDRQARTFCGAVREADARAACGRAAVRAAALGAADRGRR